MATEKTVPAPDDLAVLIDAASRRKCTYCGASWQPCVTDGGPGYHLARFLLIGRLTRESIGTLTQAAGTQAVSGIVRDARGAASGGTSAGETKADRILDVVTSLVDVLLATGREIDDELLPGDIEAEVASGRITVEHMAARFTQELRARLDREVAGR